ncbi:hypothetical protein QRD02_14305, partial [Aequorivita sp. SDUM287046]
MAALVGKSPPVGIAPEPNVQSHDPWLISVDHPAGSEVPAKSSVTEVTLPAGPQVITGAVLSITFTVAKHVETLPLSSVTVTSTIFSPMSAHV